MSDVGRTRGLRILQILALALAVLSSVGSERSVQGELSTEFVLDNEWKLQGGIFAVMPTDGFPIMFHADGVVETANLGLVDSWRIGSELPLSAPSRSFRRADNSVETVYIWRLRIRSVNNFWCISDACAQDDGKSRFPNTTSSIAARTC